jgi:hypothetical protein
MLKYSYKLIPGQGYVGFVNNKRFTGTYDERDLQELKSYLNKLQELENQSQESKTKQKETNSNKSFREWMVETNPKLASAYEQHLQKKAKSI